MLRLLLLKIYILSLENINLIKISQSLHCGFRICDVTFKWFTKFGLLSISKNIHYIKGLSNFF